MNKDNDKDIVTVDALRLLSDCKQCARDMKFKVDQSFGLILVKPPELGGWGVDFVSEPPETTSVLTSYSRFYFLNSIRPQPHSFRPSRLQHSSHFHILI